MKLAIVVLAVTFAFAGSTCKGKDKKSGPAEVAHDAAAVKVASSANAKAVDLLAKAIENRYSHRDRENIDWKALMAENRAALESATSAKDFGERVAKMLAGAKDTHITVAVEGVPSLIPTYKAPLEFNIDLSLITKRIDGIRDIDLCVAVGKVDDKTGYLLLKSFLSGRCKHFGGAFVTAWKEIGGLPRMIIDVRGNTGGDETLGRVVASRFVEGDITYALTELGPPRNQATQFPRRIMGAAEGQRYEGDVRVLIGGGIMSSSESFVLMMQKGARVKTVGAKTYGSSGNPKGVVLGNGVTVNLPSWRAFTADGVAIEGVGVKPDIAVDWPKNTKVDVVLDAAMASF